MQIYFNDLWIWHDNIYERETSYVKTRIIVQTNEPKSSIQKWFIKIEDP